MGLCVHHIAPSKLFSISNPTYHFRCTLFEVAYHRYIIGHFVEWNGGMWWNGTVERIISRYGGTANQEM